MQQKNFKKTPRVLVTGVFDLLHEEHKLFLKKAKLIGGELWVGIESDKRVTKLKGEGRPIESAQKRLGKLEKLGIIDRVFILPEEFDSPDQHLALLKQIRPDILAVSSHTPRLKEKKYLMAKIGGRVVVVHQHNPKVSTTQNLRKK